MSVCFSLIQPDSAYVNGEWVQSQSNQYFDIYDPASGRVVAKVPDLDESQCVAAIEGASAAAEKLKSLTGKSRGQILRRWFELVLESKDDIAQLITVENGKPLAEAKGEVSYASDFIDWFAGAAPRISGTVEQASNPSNRVITIKQPVGIVGIITPWNFPAAMITRKVAAALAAGCPCIVKPAPETPLTALALANLASRAGFPDGSISIVTTRKNTIAIGKVLTQHPLIRKFSFTGSTAAGKILSSQCTQTVKRVSLELGGNAPVIVFEDADLERTTDAILMSKFRLSGQTCVCANRIYVQSSIYDKLAAMLKAKVERFRLGAGLDPETTHGPLINKQAVDKVDYHVRDAVERGAKILVGGQRAPQLGESFYLPTILLDVPFDALCAREETFGPLLPMFKFETEDEVMTLANKLEAGLAGYLFTTNVSRAWQVAEGVEVGMIGVNTGIISDVASPFGGVKQSGQGREGSSIGIDEYLEVSPIIVNGKIKTMADIPYPSRSKALLLAFSQKELWADSCFLFFTSLFERDRCNRTTLGSNTS
ncbi:aldehyde dehydrogenase [Aaosphaeria arxii CBS 175.79]|uniref:succinate-semialdehyde dehydrogenase [NAD(P)(+)] n=1 Tax=Aaosphaeria arxii CBS 175.79 TaxID=1450172 RepID=A0A6A5XZA4_9PLEO|nr:aldehyde dehydrogenase [Aaosphaeria arxii CBS 175.79]KAF2018233.1 aldehyde dehydrogenase [Aaosphaeria arxii CBS 175.79]